MNLIIKIIACCIAIDFIIGVIWTIASIGILTYAKYKDWKNGRIQ